MKELTLLLLSWITLAHSQGQPRVINGEQARPGQFPYQAYISDNLIACGASIIHERWLLTAAHCRHKRPNTSYAFVGTMVRNYGRMIRFEKFIAHKDFAIKRKRVVNDIALIRLDEDIEFDFLTQPIKLARDETNDYAHVMATVSGWGIKTQGNLPRDLQPHRLQYASLEVVSEKECSQIWRSHMKNQICTLGGLFQKNRQSPCSGDSGGPLVYDKKQIGIVSYGKSRCAFFTPMVFTRVASYVPWIQHQLQLYSDKLPS